MKTQSAAKPKVVTPTAWLSARLRLLKEEKKFTRLQDKINERRRVLPWVKIEKDYAFATPKGKATLADLFGPHSQLIVQHFMLGPGWEQGCKSCSFMMDHFAPTVPHLAARDVAFTAISRAPIKEILPFKKRMGWNVNWVSAHDTDFNRDFHVSFTEEEMAGSRMEYNYTMMDFPQSEAPGISVFAKDAAGTVYHTYSTYGRGVEIIMGTYRLLDMVPKGRDEDQDEYGMEWLRHHDNYKHASAAR
jgi:predicted dithiol-disulfide oxidoreductase (DUF899 family)